MTTPQSTPVLLTLRTAFRRLTRWLGALALAAGALPALAAVPAAERQVLVDLYNGTNGAGWLTSTNWLTGDPCANAWYGITCDAAGTHVTEVLLNSNDLSGSLPAALNQLTALKSFNVYANRLGGAIPPLSGLTALEGFYVHSNYLTGPIPPLTGLTALQAIAVRDNRLSGTIPSLSGLTALKVFAAQNNQLTGAIPPSLSGLTALALFDVSNNRLTGTIPPLSRLTALRWFIADVNQLTGAIPSLSGLTALEAFAVRYNQLTGAIPSLSGLTALDLFAVQSNQLTGAIPSLSGLTALEFFYVKDNQLIGTPPAAPASLMAGNSSLCPNYLSTPSPTDAAWNTATNTTPWSQNCTAAPTYSVTVSAGAGTANPAAPTGGPGATLSINLTPPAGQVVSQVSSTCGLPAGQPAAVTSGPLASFTTLPLIADCTVTVSYRPGVYAVTATASPAVGGGVSCTSPVAGGSTTSCTAAANPGYTLAQMSGCGGTAGSSSPYTTGPVTAACTVTASFTAITTFSGTTVPPAGGTPGPASASFTGGGGSCRFDAANTAFIAAPAPPPPGQTLPQGMFKFKLMGCDTTPVTMSVTWPQPVSGYTKYGKASSSAAASSYFAPTALAVGGNTATFTVTDGQLGDDDWAVNGSIVDPNGPLQAMAVTPVPTLSEWTLMALGLLLAGLGAGGLGRRRPV